jgi:hypothetical protein
MRRHSLMGIAFSRKYGREAMADPVLSVCGVISGLVTADVAEEMVRKPRTSLIEIANVGHALAPMAVASSNAIRDFFNST